MVPGNLTNVKHCSVVNGTKKCESDGTIRKQQGVSIHNPEYSSEAEFSLPYAGNFAVEGDDILVQREDPACRSILLCDR